MSQSAKSAKGMFRSSSRVVVNRSASSPRGQRAAKKEPFTIAPREDIVRYVGALDDGTHIVQHEDGKLERRRSETDWDAVDALTDEEITAAVEADPDAVPIDFDWTKAIVVAPSKKKAISIRLDEDVLDFFKKEGGGYQRRMNAVLRSYVAAAIKRG